MTKERILEITKQVRQEMAKASQEEIAAEVKKRVNEEVTLEKSDQNLAEEMMKDFETEEEEEDEELPPGGMQKAYEKKGIDELGGEGKVNQKALEEAKKEFATYVSTKATTAQSGVDAAGGYTVPTILAKEILKESVEEVNFVKDAQVVKLKKGDSYKYLVRTERVGKPVDTTELGQVQQTPAGAWGELEIKVFDLEAEPYISVNLLDDSNVDVEKVVLEEIKEEFADLIETKLVTSTGDGISTGIEGVMTNAAIPVLTTSTLGKVSPEDIVNLKYKIPRKYRKGAKLYISDGLEQELANYRTTDGKKLWNGGDETKGIPATFDGTKVEFLKDLPDVATGAKVAFMGNLKKVYCVVMKAKVYTLKDPYSDKKVIKYYTKTRVGGRVVRPNRGAILQVQ